jgi:hypothetical protein
MKIIRPDPFKTPSTPAAPVAPFVVVPMTASAPPPSSEAVDALTAAMKKEIQSLGEKLAALENKAPKHEATDLAEAKVLQDHFKALEARLQQQHKEFSERMAAIQSGLDAGQAKVERAVADCLRLVNERLAAVQTPIAGTIAQHQKALDKIVEDLGGITRVVADVSKAQATPPPPTPAAVVQAPPPPERLWTDHAWSKDAMTEMLRRRVAENEGEAPSIEEPPSPKPGLFTRVKDFFNAPIVDVPRRK